MSLLAIISCWKYKLKVSRRFMAEILPSIQHKTLYNQSINQSKVLVRLYIWRHVIYCPQCLRFERNMFKSTKKSYKQKIYSFEYPLFISSNKFAIFASQGFLIRTASQKNPWPSELSKSRQNLWNAIGLKWYLLTNQRVRNENDVFISFRSEYF